VHNLFTALKASLLPNDWAECIQIWLALFLQLIILSIFFIALSEGRWLLSFTAIIVAFLTFLPAIIERELGVQLPIEFTLPTCLFLSASFVLGEFQQFYELFWWWDLMLHSFAALVLGLTGFLFIYVFYKSNRVQMAPIYVAFISFGTAMSLGALWEIFEFLMDLSWGLNMQKSGLVDTMTDLIVDAIGGLIAAWIGYQYVKGSDSMIADRIVRSFIDKNPHLFRRKKHA
jgi:hypothetical protein